MLWTLLFAMVSCDAVPNPDDDTTAALGGGGSFTLSRLAWSDGSYHAPASEGSWGRYSRPPDSLAWANLVRVSALDLELDRDGRYEISFRGQVAQSGSQPWREEPVSNAWSGTYVEANGLLWLSPGDPTTDAVVVGRFQNGVLRLHLDQWAHWSIEGPWHLLQTYGSIELSGQMQSTLRPAEARTFHGRPLLSTDTWGRINWTVDFSVVLGRSISVSTRDGGTELTETPYERSYSAVDGGDVWLFGGTDFWMIWDDRLHIPRLSLGVGEHSRLILDGGQACTGADPAQFMVPAVRGTRWTYDYVQRTSGWTPATGASSTQLEGIATWTVEEVDLLSTRPSGEQCVRSSDLYRLTIEETLVGRYEQSSDQDPTGISVDTTRVRQFPIFISETQLSVGIYADRIAPIILEDFGSSQGSIEDDVLYQAGMGGSAGVEYVASSGLGFTRLLHRQGQREFGWSEAVTLRR